MTQVCDRDVEAIKQWLAKEQHLPKNFGNYRKQITVIDVLT